ncbi:MAG: 16S rRNA (cytosine(1402)-N(4))-methyltransferase RsmH [Patescibacteria group bacterium]|jgi:16S rRNA (cytosine1402-N4)-methyltransferase
MEYNHVPVMLEEAIEYLNPKEGEIFVDCTLGGGGYTRAISKKVGKKGKVIAIDADEMAINNSEILNAKHNILNTVLINDNFKNLQKIIKENGVEKNVSGIVFDLGLSSAQLEDRSRGFSFRLDAPLDMKFSQKSKVHKVESLQTYNIINKWNIEDLEKIIREYGEERYAGRIAKAVVKNRPLSTTKQLAEVIKNAVPKSYTHGRIPSHTRMRGWAGKNPATRTFQALRIATNDELNILRDVLPQALDCLQIGGRIVVISYHSLEDRIVKNFFKQESRECICPPERILCNCGHITEVKILTKKPITPTEDEIKNNPRARSAKLRAVARVTSNQ